MVKLDRATQSVPKPLVLQRDVDLEASENPLPAFGDKGILRASICCIIPARLSGCERPFLRSFSSVLKPDATLILGTIGFYPSPQTIRHYFFASPFWQR